MEATDQSKSGQSNSRRTKTVVAGIAAGVVAVAGAVWFVSDSTQKPNVPTEIPAASEAQYQPGVHYRELEAAQSTSSEKVSVTEFFWFGCPHCQKFEPYANQWLQSASEDIDFKQVPVVWHEASKLHAGMYYVAQQAENPAELHEKLFEKIIGLRQEKSLAAQQEQVAELFVEHGVSAADLAERLQSDAIKSKVAAGEKLMRAAGIAGTPTLMVNGQWVLNNDAVAGPQQLFGVVDYLVERAKTDPK